MLTKLRLKNFKSWQDSGDIRLAPLTVLFGTNSAGKTSIPQLLLLLKQTAESPDRQRALQLGDSRTLVDAGTYDDIVHGHDVSQPIEFTLGWTLEAPLEINDPISSAHFEGDELEFAARLAADKRHQPRTEWFRYELRREGAGVIDLAVTERSEDRRQRKQAEFDLSSSQYALTRYAGRAWPLPEPVRFYGFPDEVAAYYQNAAFAADLVLELERMLKSVFYVGPLREYPKRLYLWSGEIPDHVGARGDRAIEAILAATDRSFNWKAKQRTKPLPQLVAERLSSMGLIYDFEVKPLGPHRKEYEVLVQTSAKLPFVKLTDVGFGVSQVLPVIVECFYVPRRSIVIFEQPEIHLHPRVQADLADLFVDAIRAREDGTPRDCQFIIESHSEHFLRRLQRRIAEEELSKEDAALLFVHTEGASARIGELDVDSYGNIKNWPEGFFGDEMADLVARTEAQARRMQKAGARRRRSPCGAWSTRT
jgi:predicted ATPase